MATIRHVSVDEVVGYFSELEDPRSQINKKHPLASVIVIALLAQTIHGVLSRLARRCLRWASNSAVAT
jgi:hypothetical protein